MREREGRGGEREKRGEVSLVTSCHHLSLAHCLAPFKLGDDSTKLFNYCIHCWPWEVFSYDVNKQNNLTIQKIQK